MSRKSTKITVFTLSLMVLFLTFPLRAAEEVFQPTYYFTGNISLIVDSYFGNYPDAPVVEIPEGITDPDELAKWKADKKHDEDIRRIFKLCNPTIPGFSQSIELDFYANPVPDLEVFVNLSHQGLWGGSGTKDALTYPLILQEAYIQYYTDNAMYTIGRYDYDLGPLGLLVGNPNGAKEGFMIHTMKWDTWITLTYNRLLMSMYREYPYVSSYLLDDMVAGRLSWKIGNNLVGVNLVANGFYDEMGLSVDFKGKLWGMSTVGELAFVYPAWVYRDLFPDHVWPGGIVSINLVENLEQILTLRVGAMGEGFISQYGEKGKSGMESPIKFNPNTAGIDLVYQRGLSDDLVLGANLFLSHYIDWNYQKKMGAQYDLRVLEVKLQKYLSEATNIRLSTAIINDNKFNYGKAEVSWNFNF